jgi:hypothetical protein
VYDLYWLGNRLGFNINKKVDRFRVFIIEYGIEIQKVKIEWLKRVRNHVSINNNEQNNDTTN